MKSTYDHTFIQAPPGLIFTSGQTGRWAIVGASWDEVTQRVVLHYQNMIDGRVFRDPASAVLNDLKRGGLKWADQQ